MADGLDEADQFTLVRRELEMARHERPTEEGECAVALVEYGAESGARRVAVHSKGPGEVRQLDHRRCGESPLEGVESRCRLRGPGETLLEQLGEGGGDGAVVLDKPAVVPRQS